MNSEAISSVTHSAIDMTAPHAAVGDRAVSVVGVASAVGPAASMVVSLIRRTTN
jgi:hypothetical protein